MKKFQQYRQTLTHLNVVCATYELNRNERLIQKLKFASMAALEKDRIYNMNFRYKAKMNVEEALYG